MARTRRVPARALEDLFAEVAGADVFSRITATFALIEAAEEETERACAEALAAGEEETMRRLWCVGLMALRPRAPMPEGLYRAHVRELLERARVRKGADLRPGTRAEILLAISRATLASRLDRDVESLALVLTRECFPEYPDREPWPESYAGRHAELLTEFRRKLRVEDRFPAEDREIPERALERIKARAA